jgi:adenylate cyclase
VPRGTDNEAPAPAADSTMVSKRRSTKAKPSVAPPAATGGAAAPSWPARLLARIRALRGVIVAIAGVGAVLGGLAGYWNAYQAARGGVSPALLATVGTGDAGPLSLVVLPFRNLTGDPQQAYLADALTAAVSADLARIRDAFIVGTATAFTYKDKPVTLAQLNRELGVRFALQGGVQRDGERIRIHAQLADTTTQAQLWSETFDGDAADLFALQELVTTRIGNSIGRAMVIVAARDSETRRSDPQVADLLLRAKALDLKSESAERNAEIERLYRSALQLEPNHVRAMSGLATHLAVVVNNGWVDEAPERARRLAEARELALRARAADPDDRNAHVALAICASLQGDADGARRAWQTLLALDPKNPVLHSNLASEHLNAGEPAQAVDLLTRAIRLDPRQVHELVLGNMGMAQFMLGDDDAAIAWLQKSLDANPALTASHAFIAMAYARKGDRARAQAAAAALRQVDPQFTLARLDTRRVEQFPPAYRRFWETRLVPAWRLAGLP